jgi:hypothetical protein
MPWRYIDGLPLDQRLRHAIRHCPKDRRSRLKRAVWSFTRQHRRDESPAGLHKAMRGGECIA